MRKNYKISLRYALATLVSVVFAQGTWAQEKLPEIAGSILTAGTTYKVSSDITINEQQAAVDANGKPVSGLVVAGGSPVIIEICKGCTLTVKGTHAAGQYGAGAGISVPSSSTLIITGEGTLIAQGGDAADGANGNDGDNAWGGNSTKEDFSEVSRKAERDEPSGAGGAGGAGGGGAAAGIGGAGGAGGSGGVGGVSVTSSSSANKDGENGKGGANGENGAGMGTVYIMGTVKVDAQPGAAATAASTSGRRGWTTYVYPPSLTTLEVYIFGGGGAGAQGGAGVAAQYGIGGGAPGAGGGGGGGGGSIDTMTKTHFRNADKTNVNHCGYGGVGIAGSSTKDQITRDNDVTRDSGAAGDVGALPCSSAKGGAGGAGGAAGSYGSNGQLYVASTADVTTGTYSATSEITTTTNPTNEVLQGLAIVKDANGANYGAHSTVNAALSYINDSKAEGTTILLTQDTNVGDGSAAEFLSPANAVTLDLNGKGLLVNGAAGDITGNANVTILLKDNGETNYTNASTVAGSPVLYQRNFAASVRANNWQALYLPFEVSAPEGYEFGYAKSITIGETESELVVKKLDADATLAAKSPYFVRSTDGKVEISLESSNDATLLPNAVTSDAVDNCTIKGSLTENDNVAGVNGAFWVLTNGGIFTWAKSGSHQRPYHWVIYDNSGNENTGARSLVLRTLGEDVFDEATGVDAAKVVDNANEIVYTINGVKVGNVKALAPGLYIKGGKKFMIGK